MEQDKEITLEDLAGMMNRGFESLRSDMDQRFDKVDNRFDGVEKRLDGVEGQLRGLDNRLDAVEQEVKATREEQRRHNYGVHPQILFTLSVSKG